MMQVQEFQTSYTYITDITVNQECNYLNIHQLIQIYFIVNILKNVTQLKLFGNSLDEVFTLKINHK